MRVSSASSGSTFYTRACCGLAPATSLSSLGVGGDLANSSERINSSDPVRQKPSKIKGNSFPGREPEFDSRRPARFDRTAPEARESLSAVPLTEAASGWRIIEFRSRQAFRPTTFGSITVSFVVDPLSRLARVPVFSGDSPGHLENERTPDLLDLLDFPKGASLNLRRGGCVI
jgi:hypothetical protein